MPYEPPKQRNLQKSHSYNLAHSLPELSLNRLNTQLAVKKALIVEDNQDILELLIQLLETLGFTVVSANTGMEGVTKAVEEKPQLILMDIMMQGMDGREATRRIRSIQETKDIPILVITAITDKSQLRECIKAGCNDYISKPFTAKDLQEKIQAVLDPPRDKQ